MRRFLKEEWENTEIPERIRLQARDGAWNRLHPERPRWLPRLAWTMAGLLLLTGAIFLYIQGTPVPEVEIAETAPGATIQPELPAVAEITAESATVEETTTEEVPPLETRVEVPPQAAPPPASPDRLVMNFILPKTGVKMIWIMDKEFQIGGDGQ